MASRRSSRFYNSPELGQIFESLGAMFAPPDSGDLANYSLARERNQRSAIIENLKSDPRYQGADAGVLADLFDPTNSWTALEMGDATARRGQDITAQTSITNNRADNQRQFVTSMFGELAPGDVRPAVPADITSVFGVDALPEAVGAPKPLSETEWKAGELERLLGAGMITDQDVAKDFLSGINVEEILGENGPQIVTRADAIGKTPAPSTPLVNIGPNGEPLGDPGPGLVWQRGADGKPVLDERGAPIAIPFQGGKVWEEQQRQETAASSRDAADATKRGVVLQNLDRALAAISTSPNLTTGVGAQATGWIGGSPARALISLLEPIRANISFEQLQAMRDASPTGGALGQVTVRELELLESVLGNIDPEAGPQVVDDIKRLKNIYLDVIHGAGNGPPRERLSFASEWDAYAAPERSVSGNEGTIAVNPATGERLVLRGGQWVPLEAGQ
ncbi:MAG TPA: hypothetical protein GYA10_10535 [Alphaproteobacteria bacterium]|nr:hypothetical protein [Alphaproteobacteria bacterium]